MLDAASEAGARTTRVVVAVGVVLASGLAGWGGSMVALAGDSTPATGSSGPVQAPVTGAPVTSSAPTTAASTAPTTPERSAAPLTVTAVAPADGGAGWSVLPRDGAASPSSAARSSAPEPVTSRREQERPDIVFVSPYDDGEETGTGRWYWSVGLLGFPADTVVEISGPDDHGNVRAGALAMTTADGAVNPFASGFRTHFPYGTCDDPKPATLTARGAGFSVTETIPRPLECDGGTTPAGPWQLPRSPAPPTSSAPPSPWDPADSE